MTYKTKCYTAFASGAILGLVVVGVITRRIPFKKDIDLQTSLTAIGIASGIVKERIHQGRYSTKEAAVADYEFEQIIAYDELKKRF